MRLTLTTAPAVEPVLPSEAIARTHLRLDTEEEAGTAIHCHTELCCLCERVFEAETRRDPIEPVPHG